ncbi:hypothetical protein SteCoe_27333 [Stentor coeruleus]|uniref:Uncharacterized protein n=1 Tax=Stentor coeruleus TaxID=5963 RepID=A0A1R2BAU4_9CILI|nr:hypothetical protein SteCoe_27333 [Stentor coeruleus]
MINIQDFDIQANLTFFLIFATGVFLGRLTKHSSPKHTFDKTLSELKYRVQSAGEKKNYYYLYHIRLKAISALLGFLFCILAYFWYFEIYSSFNISVGKITIAGFVVLIIYVTSYFAMWASQEYETRQKMYIEQISRSKSEIMKEMGPEVVDILRNTECSKKCKEEIDGLNKIVKRYQVLLEKFAKFPWCDACPQGRRCPDMCGPNFWAYAREALKDFKSTSAN